MMVWKTEIMQITSESQKCIFVIHNIACVIYIFYVATICYGFLVPEAITTLHEGHLGLGLFGY